MLRRNPREQGTALVFVILLGLTLLALTATSVELSRNQALAYSTAEADDNAREIADSALALAITSIRDGGVAEPHSGSGSSATWVEFGTGEYYYDSALSTDGTVNNVVVWSRVPLKDSPSTSAVSPESEQWDGDGWLVRGLEVAIENNKFIPNSPLYFGKGGIQAPVGGFAFSGSTDLSDPDSWDRVPSGAGESEQSSNVPFQISALDHPADFLTSGDAPAAATTPHPYPIVASTNPIAQLNAEAWFNNSAGSGDASAGAVPDLNMGFYEMLDRDDPNYAFPVDPDTPKVQALASKLWQRHATDPASNVLSEGSHSGTFGSLENPEITFVTGGLTVPSGSTLEGAGILVIRDDYDPNVDTDNQPSTRAWLEVQGTLEWTGLVLVVGWNPYIRTDSGSTTRVVGAFLGEDSVQSGGEPSLDSSCIIMEIRGSVRVHYSRSMFLEGGQMHDLLPDVERTIVGIRSRSAH